MYKQESLANAKVARDSLHVKNGFWREIGTQVALKVIQGHLFCNQLQADKG